MVNNPLLSDKIKFLQNAVGAILSPFDSYQVLKGIKTLSVRMQKHQENARAVVDFLLKQPKVKKIYYPGLITHPGHEIAKKQMLGYGGIVSFELYADLEKTIRFLESLSLISIAESLGAVETLIEHPASMTHASIPREERIKIGLSDNLIRLSVGIENDNDIISDLNGAFNKI